MIWFISDTHFGHELVFEKFRKKKFNIKNIEEHDEMLITVWNHYIKEEDLVYFLGDFSFLGIPKTRDEILPRLNGNKVFLIGNHDRKRIRNLLARFGEVHQDTLKIEYKGKTFILSHYPIEDWMGRKKGYIHVHGHVHEHNWRRKHIRNIKNRYNVCFDIVKRPISADEIIKQYNKVNSNILKDFKVWTTKVVKKLGLWLKSFIIPQQQQRSSE